MATFTTEEKLSIAKIAAITPTLLDAHLTSLGTLSAEVVAAVQAELARWDTFGAAFVKIHPKESNKGVETDSGDAKADIRNNIAVLLELTDHLYTDSGLGTIQVAAPGYY